VRHLAERFGHRARLRLLERRQHAGVDQRAAGPGEPRHRRIVRNVPDRVDEPASRGEQVVQPFIRRRPAGAERHRPEEPVHQRAELFVDRHSLIVPATWMPLLATVTSWPPLNPLCLLALIPAQERTGMYAELVVRIR
jgi:hypothetical protein